MSTRCLFGVLILVLCACQAPPEPLVLPSDPADTGVPVGVTTVQANGVTMEIWYPASDAVADQPGEMLDFFQFVSPEILDRLGEVSLTELSGIALRDVDLRVPESPYPVVLFSHGFGGMRIQSVDFTSHLASRGYVVVAVDHPGRSMPDLLPCLFNPPLDGCDLTGMMGDDPGPVQLTAALDWIDDANTATDGFFSGALDTESIGVAGHSAGGFSSCALTDTNNRIQAALPMAGAGPLEREVPTLVMSGTCDVTVNQASMDEAWLAMNGATIARIHGAGHLAFSDLCALNLGDFADTHLYPREDINTVFVDQLVALATDGCPNEPVPDPPIDDCASEFLDLEESAQIIRHLSTTFFDQALQGTGSGVAPDAFSTVTVETDS